MEPVLLVPELRDYRRINADLVQLLDRGHLRVILEGVEGQRLLLHGLAGDWRATVELRGRAGPELAAGLDAPRLAVACRGDALDGAGSGMRAGRLLIVGDAGDAVGYAMRAGTIVVAGRAGHRAGLDQSGGTIVLRGPAGRLAGERQSGGTLFAEASALGPFAGNGRRGGRLIAPSVDIEAFLNAQDWAAPWLSQT